MPLRRISFQCNWLVWQALLAFGCAHASEEVAPPIENARIRSREQVTVAPPRQQGVPVLAVPLASGREPPETPRASASAADKVWDPGLANIDPADDSVVGPPDAIEDCESRLRAANVRFRLASLPMVKRKGMICGAPQVVEYLEGPGHIRFNPHPVVTCQLALALAHFEQVLQRTVSEVLATEVRSIAQGGTYSCRSMARFRLVSEHSYANAIDLYSFGMKDGRTVSVVRHFGNPRDSAQSPESKFLRVLANRLFDDEVFSVVVTRYFDELHRDHIHVDMARYRTDGSR